MSSTLDANSLIPESNLPLTSASPTDELRAVRGGKSVRVPILSLPASPAVQEQIDALAAGQAAGRITARTWSELSARTGASGVGADVIDDTGSHTDPVTAATVPNAGGYVWNESPAGWRWVRPDVLPLKADKADVDALTPVVEALVPAVDALTPVVERTGEAVKVGTWPGVLFGVTDSVGRATWLQASETDGGMPEYTKGIVRDSVGVRHADFPNVGAAVTMRLADGTEVLTDLTVRAHDGQFMDFVVDRLADRIASRLGGQCGAGIALDRYIVGDATFNAMPDMSMVSGWGSSSMEYCRYHLPGLLSDLNESPSYYNGGDGGIWSQHTCAQLGSIPALLSFPGDEIPASGSVEVSHNLPSSTSMIPFAGVVAGVHGTFSLSGSVGTFTRTDAGSAVPCPPNSPFYPEQGVAHKGGVLLLWMGKNNFSNVTAGREQAVIECTWESFKYGGHLFPRRLVIGHFADTGTPADGLSRTQILTTNADYAQRYGSYYVDIYDYCTSGEMFEDMGLTPTPDDLAEMALGNLPPSLSMDAKHFSHAGYAAISRRIVRRMIDLGWYNEQESEQ